MVRTQIQLTDDQVSALRAMAAARHVSIAELIRRSVDLLVESEGASDREAVLARAKAAVDNRPKAGRAVLQFCQGSGPPFAFWPRDRMAHCPFEDKEGAI